MRRARCPPGAKTSISTFTRGQADRRVRADSAMTAASMSETRCRTGRWAGAIARASAHSAALARAGLLVAKGEAAVKLRSSFRMLMSLIGLLLTQAPIAGHGRPIPG